VLTSFEYEEQVTAKNYSKRVGLQKFEYSGDKFPYAVGSDNV
jgi:hypothetical protein